MILYNVTISIEKESSQEWQKWMKTKHIPEVMAVGIFKEYKFLRLMTEIEDNQGDTFAIQYFCENMKALDHYMEQFATKLQNEHTEKYKGKFIAFRTILQEV